MAATLHHTAATLQHTDTTLQHTAATLQHTGTPLDTAYTLLRGLDKCLENLLGHCHIVSGDTERLQHLKPVVAFACEFVHVFLVNTVQAVLLVHVVILAQSLTTGWQWNLTRTACLRIFTGTD